MSFSLTEIPGSRTSTVNPPTHTRRYRATGVFDSATVESAALVLIPAYVDLTLGRLFRQDLQIEEDGWSNYLITAPFGQQEREVGSFGFRFDTTGATVNIKAAKEHIGTYDSTGKLTGNFHKGAINVREDGDVGGADIVIPALRLTYTFKHPAGAVTEAFARSIAAATGSTNLNPFRGFQSEELLFIGASGADGSDADAEVSYEFIGEGEAIGDNKISIGEIKDIVKKGHHLLWVEFKDDVENGNPVRPPWRVHIERVYDPIDFAARFGWS